MDKKYLKPNNKIDKKENYLWLALIIGILLLIIYYLIFSPYILNIPLWIYFIPLTGSLVCLFVTRNRLLLYGIKNETSKTTKTLLALYNGLKYSFSFYMIILAMILLPFWFISNSYSKAYKIEQDNFEILAISGGSGTVKSPSFIRFKFKGRITNFKVDYDIYKTLNQKGIGELPSFIKVDYRQGLFGSFILEKWQIVY